MPGKATLSAQGKRCSRRSGRGSSWIVKTRRLAIYLRDEFTCSYCGRDLHDADRREIHLDHLIPQVEGGGHESSNLVTACRDCNCGRKDTPWREYATPGAVARIKRNIRRQVNMELARALILGQTGGTAS